VQSRDTTLGERQQRVEFWPREWLALSGALDFDETAGAIWEQLANIGKEAPAGTWESVPNDLSMRIDEIVYGHGEGKQ